MATRISKPSLSLSKSRLIALTTETLLTPPCLTTMLQPHRNRQKRCNSFDSLDIFSNFHSDTKKRSDLPESTPEFTESSVHPQVFTNDVMTNEQISTFVSGIYMLLVEHLPVLNLSEEVKPEFVYRLTHMLRFVRDRTDFQVSEAIIALFLIYNFVQAEQFDTVNAGHPCLTEQNIGTFFLCNLMITIKMTRDVPYNNSWWSYTFNVPLKVLNESEIMFLQKVKYNVVLQPSDYDLVIPYFDIC
ncbi:hypothetical protein BLNAU_19096 [Blattamonas nauphoetae]|uniref:Cyclin N-terminal domain-containing protein n=1 Tax=Blattamonas nauphoetae TaxID=2049346 RepID=A0ABQ9X2N6_9EUKA|nr:hypothetical protein BLNAU_19096 [Blattamonas nauphoetae]